MCGQISSVAETSASPAAAAKRTGVVEQGLGEPIWIEGRRPAPRDRIEGRKARSSGHSGGAKALGQLLQVSFLK